MALTDKKSAISCTHKDRVSRESGWCQEDMEDHEEKPGTRRFRRPLEFILDTGKVSKLGRDLTKHYSKEGGKVAR